MGYGMGGGGFDGSFILFLILILLVFSMPYGGGYYGEKKQVIRGPWVTGAFYFVQENYINAGDVITRQVLLIST